MSQEILVIIPHASRKRPPEIKKEWLSPHQQQLLYSETAETDRYSELLYDFKPILGNQQLLFPFNQVYINICRHPDRLDDICPLEIRGKPVYNSVIPLALRKKLVTKYVLPFHQQVAEFKGEIILNGHTTQPGHSSLTQKMVDDVVLSNFILSRRKRIISAPIGLIQLYAEEIKQRLPWIKIGINSIYLDVYDYFSEHFAWEKKGIPLIVQETDEGLYIKKNKLDKNKLYELRNTFAASLSKALERFKLQDKD